MATFGAARRACDRWRFFPRGAFPRRRARFSRTAQEEAARDELFSWLPLRCSAVKNTVGALKGHSFVAADKTMLVVSRPLEADPVLSLLTPAERSVLAVLVRGATNAEIATLRRTSPRTVANQMAALFRSTGIRSRYDLVARFALTWLEKR